MGRYVKNVLIGIDQLVNAMIGGDPDETLSSRIAKSQYNWAARVAGRFLEWVDPGHLEKAREDDEGRDALM